MCLTSPPLEKIKSKREKVTELLEEAWHLCICNAEKDFGVVIEQLVIFEQPGCLWSEKDKYDPATLWKTVSPPAPMQY